MDLRIFLKKQDRRRLEIIETLFYHPAGLTKQDLIQRTGITRRILEKDIHSINEQHPYLKIHLRKNLFSIEAEEHIALDTVYSYYLTHSEEAKFLALLFQENCWTNVEAADALFISPASLYRMLAKFEDFFAPYHVTISSRPLRLKGNEVFIRYLFTLFFSQQRNKPDFFFDDQRIPQQLFTLTANFLRDNLLRSNYYIHDQLFYSACVGIWRERRGHMLPLHQNHFFNVTPELEMAIQELNQLPYFQKYGHFQVAKAFWLIYYNYLLLSLEQYQEAILQDQRLQQINQVWQKLLGLLEREAALTIDEPHKKSLLARLCNENYAYAPHSDFISVFRRPVKEFIVNYQRRYPKNVLFLRKLIADFEEGVCHQPTEDQVDNLIYILITGLPNLFDHVQPVIDVLILSDLSIFHNDYLATEIRQHFQHNINFHALDEIFADTQEIFQQMASYDLIISTFSLPPVYDRLNLLTVKPLLEYADLSRIHEKLKVILESKWKI